MIPLPHPRMNALDAQSEADSSCIMLTKEEIAGLKRDFSKTRMSRASASKFDCLVRGSARLRRGLYRTEDEFDAYIKSGLAIRLPGVDRA